MIQVGLHENLVINKVEVTEEQSGKALNVTFKIGSSSSVKSDDLLTMLNSTVESVSQGGEQNFKFYGLNSNKMDGSSLGGDNVLKNITTRKAVLEHILVCYMVKDKIKWDLFKGVLGINKDNLVSKLEDQVVLDAVNANMNDQFIAMMKPHVKDDGKKLYGKFIRKSATSNFPTLPSRFLDSQPFLAPMDDQAAKDKVKFSKWEIDNKLNSSDRGDVNSDATPSDLAAQTEAVKSVFG